MFEARYKKYAAWPVVIWCRLMKHRGQPVWGQAERCLRCGDLTGRLRYDKARRTIVVDRSVRP